MTEETVETLIDRSSKAKSEDMETAATESNRKAGANRASERVIEPWNLMSVAEERAAAVAAAEGDCSTGEKPGGLEARVQGVSSDRNRMSSGGSACRRRSAIQPPRAQPGTAEAAREAPAGSELVVVVVEGRRCLAREGGDW